MASSIQSDSSYYMEFLRCPLCKHDFKFKDGLRHPITLPKSGFTMCRKCINIIHDETKCPFVHVSVGMNYTSIDQLPINYPLLLVRYEQSEVNIK